MQEARSTSWRKATDRQPRRARTPKRVRQFVELNACGRSRRFRQACAIADNGRFVDLRAKHQVGEERPCACVDEARPSRFLDRTDRAEFGIEHLIATEAERVDGRYTGHVAGLPNTREGKVERLPSGSARAGDRSAISATSVSTAIRRTTCRCCRASPSGGRQSPMPVLAAHARHMGWPQRGSRAGDIAMTRPHHRRQGARAAPHAKTSRAGSRPASPPGWPPPGLAVVLVGDNPASQVYVRNKRRTTEAVGMRSFAHDLPADTSQAELLALDRRAERAIRR